MTGDGLTEAQADSVAWLADQEFSAAEIAGTLGLSVGSVTFALRADRPATTEAVPCKGRRPGGGARARPTGRPALLSAEQVSEAAAKRAEGLSLRRIGQQLGVSRETVRAALLRLTAGRSADAVASADPPAALPEVERAESLAEVLAAVNQEWEAGRADRERRARIEHARAHGVHQPGDPPARRAPFDLQRAIW